MKNNLRTKIISTAVIVFLVIADQLIKFFVCLYLKPVGAKMLIPGFIQLRYLENDGAMMGMMSGKTSLMTV
ncbi:MAG: signal peptidase II, partial [Clostridia bacterium]|nr:signal peptidase II [Clostridia bacterium]